MAKATTPKEEKLERQDIDLFEVLAAIDRKDYGYYDSLSDEQKKKLVPKILTQWFSSVQGSSAIQQYHVISTNSYANKHMFSDFMIKNPKLHWMLLCVAGLGNGKQFHKWVPQMKEKVADLREKASLTDVKEFYKKIYPKIDNDTLNELSKLYTDQQNKKVYFANKFPSMKLEDIEILSEFTTQKEIDQYEQEYGN